MDTSRDKGELLNKLIGLLEQYTRPKSEKLHKELVAFNLPALA